MRIRHASPVFLFISLAILISTSVCEEDDATTHTTVNVPDPSESFTLEDSKALVTGKLTEAHHLVQARDKLVQGKRQLEQINQELENFVADLPTGPNKAHLSNLVENNKGWTDNLGSAIDIGVETINILSFYAERKEQEPLRVAASLNKIRMSASDMAKQSLRLWVKNSRILIADGQRDFPRLYGESYLMIEGVESKLNEIEDALQGGFDGDSLRLLYDSSRSMKEFHNEMAERAAEFADTMAAEGKDAIGEDLAEDEEEMDERLSNVCRARKNDLLARNLGHDLSQYGTCSDRRMTIEDYRQHSRLHRTASRSWEAVFIAVGTAILFAGAASFGACG